MSPRAQVLGNLPKERPDVLTSPTYIYVGLSLELGAYNESSRELAIVVMYYR